MEKIIFSICDHTNLGDPLTHLFDEGRFHKKDSIEESECAYTWSYYECPVCHQILIFRKEDE